MAMGVQSRAGRGNRVQGVAQQSWQHTVRTALDCVTPPSSTPCDRQQPPKIRSALIAASARIRSHGTARAEVSGGFRPHRPQHVSACMTVACAARSLHHHPAAAAASDRQKGLQSHHTANPRGTVQSRSDCNPGRAAQVEPLTSLYLGRTTF
jgi:hypothetical protein